MNKIDGLKVFRREKGLTVERMAQNLGFSASYVSQIENGHAAPALGFLQKLKTAYPDVNIDEVFFTNTAKEIKTGR